MPRPDEGSLTEEEINKRNLNKPTSELICPKCEAQNAVHDRNEHEHPGVFECGDCHHTFLA